MSVRITDIQHFSLHDGPGIRTTVFLKGCNLKCPWCANPECISHEFEGEFGRDISTEDLEKEILKDKHYYSLNDGGVTFSGGEPLLQINKLENLLISLKKQNINICFETSLFINENQLKAAIPYVDEFIVDVKILVKDLCKNVIGGDVSLYQKNLKLLFAENKKVTFRILVCEQVLNNENVHLILELISKYQPYQVEIFKVHNLAKDKYDALNKEFHPSNTSDEDLESLFNQIKTIFPNVKILEL